MPISYEAPQPFSPQISGAYGAAQQFSQDLPTQARLAEATAQANQHATALGLQASEAAARVNLQQQALAQQGALARDQLGEHARQADAGRDLQASMFQANLQQQPLMAQQHAELQAWLGQQALSAQEQVHYRQLQNSIGAVMSDPELQDDPETRDALLFKIKTGLDKYAPRIQAAEAQKIKEAAEVAKTQAIHAKTLNDLLAQGPEARLSSHELPDGTYMHRFMGGDGKEHVSFTKPEGGGAADRLEVQRQKVEFAQAAKGHLTPEKYLQAYNAAAAEVDKRKAAGEDVGDRTAAVASALQARGLALSWEQQNARQQAELKALGLLGGGNAATPQAPQGGNAATPQQRPGVVPAAEQLKWKSFKADDPSTQNEQQRDYVKQADAELKEFRDRPDLTKPVREGAVTAVEQSRKLMEKYGSAERMRAESPVDFEAFQLMDQFIKALPPARARPPAVQSNMPTRQEMYTPFPNG